nr:putative ribonuclease h protein [Quercus suber]
MDDNSCPLCHSSNESIVHALKDCAMVKPIWFQLGAHDIDNLFFDRGINEWLKGLNPHLAKEIIQRAFKYNLCVAPTKVPMCRVATPVQRFKPKAGWMKLNTDGSSLGNPSMVGGGGLIRNEEGRWVVGFACKIGITSSFFVELWALRDGLSLCVSRSC